MADTDVLSDQEIIARTLDGEAGNQGKLGMQAVANVIMQRQKQRWKGDTTLAAVCLHRKQFSCWNPGRDRDRIMAGNYLTPPMCLMLAGMALSGMLPDIANGADSYEVTGTNAYWEKGLKPVAVIGKHSFYITRQIKSADPKVGALNTQSV